MIKKLMFNQAGGTLMVALLFTAIFVIVASALSGLAISQNKLGQKKIAWEKALQIAEAGLNYYRWHLAHDSEDYQDGTGVPGPYTHTYEDPESGTIGAFELEIIPPAQCSGAVRIRSTGWAAEEPNTRRTLEARYAQPSLAKFAFLTNSNAWFGEDEELHGPVHSNGGVRQDGENDGLMTSAKETYICGSEHGCSGQTKPGIWGEGEIQELWDFPAPVVNFEAITIDLDLLRDEAQANGYYFDSSGLGYHLILKDNGSFDIYQVTELRPNVASLDETGWHNDTLDIQAETLIGNYVLPSACSVIFVEDWLWVEGEINNKALTIVSADLPDLSETNTTIIINGNLTYKEKNENTSLALIAQKDVLVPLYAAPENLEINAVLLAQKGKVMRRHYTATYSPYHLLDYIEIYGAIITNKVWTWTWVNAGGNPISGYENTETIYDPSLKYNPPPGFPTESQYDFIQWEEITN